MRRSEILTKLHAIDFGLRSLNLLFPAIEADEPTPDVADEPTPEATDEPTPDVADEPTPDVADEPTPDVADEPTPEATDEPTPEATDGSEWINDTIEAFIKEFIISDSFNRITQFKEVVDWLIDNPETLDEDVRRFINDIKEGATIAIQNINKVKRGLNSNQIFRLMSVVAPFDANCRFLRKYCRPMNTTPQLKEVSEEPQSKKKGRPKENFEDYIKNKHKNDTKTIIERIRTLIEGKNGKAVAEVIKAAINAGYIVKPGYPAFIGIFPNSIDRHSFYKYLGKGGDLTVSEDIARKILL